jgi:hypothetical protein
MNENLILAGRGETGHWKYYAQAKFTFNPLHNYCLYLNMSPMLCTITLLQVYGADLYALLA